MLARDPKDLARGPTPAPAILDDTPLLDLYEARDIARNAGKYQRANLLTRAIYDREGLPYMGPQGGRIYVAELLMLAGGFGLLFALLFLVPGGWA